MQNEQEVIERLREATKGLLFMSDSDYPFEIVSWDQEVTPEFLRQQAAAEPDAPLEEQTVADFFSVAAGEQERKAESAIATAKQYQALIQLLKDNLADVRVCRVGRINMVVYVLGRSTSGKMIGVSTRIVET